MQVIPSAPDPASIHVPTAAATAASTAAQALPTGPTLRLSPEDVWRRTVAVMAEQTSASLTVDLRDGQGRPVHAVSSVASDGDCVGRISAGGGQAQVIDAGSTHYLKGDSAFWAWAVSQPGAYGVPEFWVGKWVRGSMATLEAYGVETMCSLSVAVGNVTADFGGAKHEVGPRSILGRQAVSVTETGSAGSLTLDVAATGPATVLRGVQRAAGSATITTTFTHLGVAVHAKAPADAVGIN
ncbi:hypothetical protein [Actinacidiphila acididurans]|nr:hypothetical protein [Actinacidiphila acididurans]